MVKQASPLLMPSFEGRRSARMALVRAKKIATETTFFSLCCSQQLEKWFCSHPGSLKILGWVEEPCQIALVKCASTGCSPRDKAYSPRCFQIPSRCDSFLGGVSRNLRASDRPTSRSCAQEFQGLRTFARGKVLIINQSAYYSLRAIKEQCFPDSVSITETSSSSKLKEPRHHTADCLLQSLFALQSHQ